MLGKFLPIFLFICSFIAGCDITPPSHAEDVTLPNLYQRTNSKLKAIQKMQPLKVPPSIVNIGVDQSGSMNSARVAKTEYADVETVLNVVSKTGGTFALSAICSRSDKPLTRVSFPQPPNLGITAIPTPPQRPDTSKGSPFKHRKLLDKYDVKVEEYEQQIAEINQKLDNHKQQLEQQQQRNQQNINQIKPAIKTVLDSPRDCQATDIQRAVYRAKWLFNEPHNFSDKPRHYAVFITDGLDSFSKESVKLTADKIILVNGSAEMGIFQSLKHDRFESPNAALQMLSEWMIK
jgi:hypothetical protein